MKVDYGANAAPALGGVLETAVYVDDLDKAERFYGGVLGLPKAFAEPGRLLVFRSQESILLVFNPQHTGRDQIVINGGRIPLHGTHGAGHVAFRVMEKELDAWRSHLHAAGVKIESEVTWPNGARSIYFRDPAGNSLELATPNMWEFGKDRSDR
jgi:catechol 2,3-dioxygenase-like lactoylglutathione lyase family enzyme